MEFHCGKWGGLSFAWWVLTLGRLPGFEHCCQAHDAAWPADTDIIFYWCVVNAGYPRWAEICYWIIRRYRALTVQY